MGSVQVEEEEELMEVAKNDALPTYHYTEKRQYCFVSYTRVFVAFIVLVFMSITLNVKNINHLQNIKHLKNIQDSDNATAASKKEFTLTPYPTLIEDGGFVVISWEKDTSKSLTSQDIVTISCGPTMGRDDYLFKEVVGESDTSDHSVTFTGLHTMRCNYTAIYYNYKEELYEFEPIAKIEIPMKEPIETPKQGHLSLTDDETAMAILFNSGTSKTPIAKYGENPQDLKLEATGTTTTYGAHDMCQGPANVIGQWGFRDPGYMHTVIMTDLKPNTYYYYQFGHEEHGLSPVRRFKSRPLESYKYANFIAYADMGTSEAPGAVSTAARVFQDVSAGGYDSFLLHFGDISYALSVSFAWDHFFRLIEPYATSLPYMVGIGNHEYGYTYGGEHDLSGGMLPYGGSFNPPWGNFYADSLGECGVPMHHRWHAPKTGNWIYWYSFNYGGIHVIQMSTEHNWTRGSEQYKWLQQDLEQVNRSVTPWVVLTAHRMMYSTQMNIESDMIISYIFQEEVEDLIYKHRVNVMMVGHQHSYERSCPVYRRKCVDDGKATVHVVVGTAGFYISGDDFSTEYGNWSRSHVNEYGYLRIASSPESMRFEFILNKNGIIYDEFTITPWKD
ncbi:unnamed protein product [Peronospora belbahrii]|uniref:Purple acid phosphatase n=1 Tax=Peronospora belbahrii TaxID=622444 RepID=A0ABN8CSG1_9STRA|nr:unnamed protein product [Peronospora belbahrii]